MKTERFNNKPVRDFKTLAMFATVGYLQPAYVSGSRRDS